MGNIDQREYQTVVLAALLHDVGKMLQRGSFGSLDTKGQHPQVSSDFVGAFKGFFSRFVDFDLFKTLVQRHHEHAGSFKDNLLCQNAPEEYRALSYLVSRADNYSSSERGERADSYQDFKATPLVSIFSRIEIDKHLPEVQRYRLNPLMSEAAFPDKFVTYEENEMNLHLRKFGEEFKNFVDAIGQSDFDIIYSHLMTILMRYSWCIPSNTQEEVPDVSLYDHLKTTSAIAACLYQYHYPNFNEVEIKNDKTNKFILLVGDLSGIQNYIFNITHVGAGGVAKRLRARSFQLNIISEIISHKILHTFNLPLANILMVSGGKFYILLPNISDAKNRIESIKKETDLWFFKNLNAEINLNITTMPLSGEDFNDYKVVMNNISQLLQQEKKKPINSLLSENGLWNEDIALLDIDFGEEEKLCKACKKFPGEYNKENDYYICSRCFDDQRIGTLLHTSNYVSFYKDNKGEFKGPLGYSFDLKESSKGVYLVMSIGGHSPVYNYPYNFRYIANYIPVFIDEDYCSKCPQKNKCINIEQVKKGQPLFFECIANESQGKKMLGYLKADVDNLGAAFAFGLKEKSTISRVSTMSRMLDVFFSGFMQKLIEDDFPEIYTVYSGGDDILVIGPWDSIIKFGEELNSKFKRFTGNNENLTLSAGIAFVKHNHPVFRSVEMADNALDNSKDNKDKESLTVFGQTIKWFMLSEIIKESEKLEEWLRQNQLSSGFVNNLLIYSQMNNSFKKTGRTEHLRFLPLMTYDIARNLPSLYDRDPKKKEIRLWAESLKNLNSPRLHHLGIISNYALMANRGKRDE
ncbi:MAG: type III-A CRISPR-associated protein Cas10/Csm1 [Nitrospirae bacterium]|nr:type III-A CRISPR-associated protein Cas10/Csm1 [Nitrospirota bacterium]